MYYYVIKYWDEEYRTDSGLVSGETWKDAADKIEDYYGGENIKEFKLSIVEGGEVLPEEELMELFDKELSD